MTVVRVLDLAKSHNTTNVTNPDHSTEPVYDIVKADYTFGILLLWTAMFAYYHVIFGVFCLRKGDIIIYIIATAIVWAYVTINYFESVDTPNTKLIRLIITTVIAPVLIGVGIKLAINYSSANQLVYYAVGPDPDDQEMFKMLLLHDTVIKFDLQMAGRCVNIQFNE